ncbi:MAG TPA: DUF6049 family protein [Acidimicrobiales bacterium]|nr:DUF6049 family protein [Acidimicrobiales bacterium]
MLLRPVRSALAAAVAIGGFVLFVAPGPASAADPAGSPALTLLNQSPAVTPAAPGDPAPFALEVHVGAAPAGAELGLTFYRKLSTRSGFEQTLGNPPTGVLQTVSPQPVADLKPGPRGGVEISVTVVPDTSQPSGSDTVDLSQEGPGCVVGNGSCSGVYPVVVEMLGSEGAVLSHFTTYLTYSEKKSTNPLVFSWVVPIAAPVLIRSGGGLSGALPPLSPIQASNLAQLAQSLVRNPGVRVSIAASPATVQKIEGSKSSRAREALTAIGELAASGPSVHQFIAEPYVPVNLGALSAAGVTTEIAGQMQGGQSIMVPLLRGLATSDQPSGTTWVASGAVDAATVKGLRFRYVNASHLVLPDTDLPPATEREATWSQPFALSAGRGQEVTAAVSDSQLSSYFTAQPHDPVLAANQLLADLAVIYYELPSAPDARGVIAVPPSDWDPDPGFVNALLSGLAADPVVTTATLPEFFNSVPSGGNQAEATRRLSSNASGQQIGSRQAASIVAAREQITGFDNAVQGQPTVGTQLDELLLASESSELNPAAQQAGIAAFQHHLAAELSDVQVVGNTVTLTARTASIPITIVSSASYQLRATLTLSSAKLQFPEGATRTVFIDHPTNSTRIEVRARTSGDLPLAYTLTSPDGTLVIARGRLTVRSTATSIVGIVLTLGAVVVLLGWWARTWRRGRRQSRTRPIRGSTT